MNFTHYQKPFQAKALGWWRSLSYNEQTALEKTHKAILISGCALRSEIARMWETEGKPEPDKVWTPA